MLTNWTPPNSPSGAPETPKTKGGRPPSKKRPRPEVAEGFEIRGFLEPQAVGFRKALQYAVNPITGELYSQRDAAARCNMDPATVAAVGEAYVSETPRSGGLSCR